MSTGGSRKQINLYQAEFRPPQIVLPTRSLLLGVAMFAAGLLLLQAWDSWQFRRYRQEADRMSAAAERIERRLAEVAPVTHPADAKVVAEAEVLEARIRALQLAEDAVASGALGSEAGYAAQFLALSRATVPGAWLTHVAITGNGQVMDLQGRALQGGAPARLIAALGRQPLFRGLSYAALDVHPPETKEGAGPGPVAPPNFLEFSLSAQPNGTNAAAAATAKGGA
jgi:hypothetical protein